MNTLVRPAFVLLAALSPFLTIESEAAPSEKTRKLVLSGAELATKKLGGEVMKGNFVYSIDKMYPRWKKRAAVRLGGEEKLRAKLLQVPEEMRKNGISMLKFEVSKPSVIHEVFLGRGEDKTGKPFQVYREWLVFVPTRTVYHYIDPTTRKPKRVERRSFQVAINTKGTAKWTFIDGSTLTVSQLRSFFPGLPEDQKLLGLPQRGGGEIKE